MEHENELNFHNSMKRGLKEPYYIMAELIHAGLLNEKRIESSVYATEKELTAVRSSMKRGLKEHSNKL
ncbi:MAG: hypothetical protein DRO09_01525 [Thermoprotei archaeon]|nr:MAG: hypothetical protein DRO09_01525 [Thermoprotei archaeon]